MSFRCIPFRCGAMRSLSIRSVLLQGCFALLAIGGIVSAAHADISEADFSAAMDKYLNSEKGSESMIKFLETAQQKQVEASKKKQMEMMQAKLEEQFKNPVKVDVGTSPSRGAANGKITIVEFSDFQCPYCKRAEDVVTQIMKTYPNDVKVVYKELPLPFHPQSRPAARAALAAGKQGKFWEMHDLLFQEQDKLADGYYDTAAKKLGLDMEKFKKDEASPETEATIKADEEQAKKLSIGGTPSFVVNGVQVNGAYPFEYFKTIIDRWLAQK